MEQPPDHNEQAESASQPDIKTTETADTANTPETPQTPAAEENKAIPFVRMVVYAVAIFATVGCITLFGAVSCLNNELTKVTR